MGVNLGSCFGQGSLWVILAGGSYEMPILSRMMQKDRIRGEVIR